MKNTELLTRVLDEERRNNISIALSLLKKYTDNEKLYREASMIERWTQSYKYMLQYAMTGKEDKGRDLLINDISNNIKGLCKDLIADLDSATSSKIFYATRRLEKIQNNSFENLLLKFALSDKRYKSDISEGKYDTSVAREREALIDNIFEYVMALPFNPTARLNIIKGLCADPNESLELKCIVVSALFVSLSQLYDRHKLITLLDIYEVSDSGRLSARLLISIMLILSQWHDEINDDISLKQRLDNWKDSIQNYTRLRDAVMAFLNTFDTSRINNKMKNEILPSFRNIPSDVLKDFQKRYGNGDLEDMEFNPEWEEMLRKSGLEDKMKEFAEMQSEGADLMMMAFSDLKALPFFNKLSHWFLSYDRNRSDLAFIRDPQNKAFARLLDVNGPFCDTDKYSFALTLSQLPDLNRRMISSQIEASLEQLKIESEEAALYQANPEFNSEMIKFLRDLYRFFNLFRLKNEFYNPLKYPLNYIKLPVLGEWLDDFELNSKAAEFYFQRGYYRDALMLYDQIVKEGSSDGFLWEKIGFCHQSLGNPQSALETYQKAEFFFPEKNWLRKMIAFCLKATQRYVEASEYYKMVLDTDPDNVRLLFNTALSLLEAKKYGEALEYCHKALFLKGNDRKIMSLTAACEILSGNISKGKNIIDRLLVEFGFDQTKDNLILLLLYNLETRDFDAAYKNFLQLGKDSKERIATVEKEFQTLEIFEKFKETFNIFKEYSEIGF